jgi:hypothetical protein
VPSRPTYSKSRNHCTSLSDLAMALRELAHPISSIVPASPGALGSYRSASAVQSNITPVSE